MSYVHGSDSNVTLSTEEKKAIEAPFLKAYRAGLRRELKSIQGATASAAFKAGRAADSMESVRDRLADIMDRLAKLEIMINEGPKGGK